MKLATQIEDVADRFSDLGEYAELHGAIWRVARRAAKEGLDGEKRGRRLETVFWRLKRRSLYARIGDDGVHLGYVAHDQATEFERYTDALAHRRAGEKVFRVSVFRVRGKVKP